MALRSIILKISSTWQSVGPMIKVINGLKKQFEDDSWFYEKALQLGNLTYVNPNMNAHSNYFSKPSLLW